MRDKAQRKFLKGTSPGAELAKAIAGKTADQIHEWAHLTTALILSAFIGITLGCIAYFNQTEDNPYNAKKIATIVGVGMLAGIAMYYSSRLSVKGMNSGFSFNFVAETMIGYGLSAFYHFNAPERLAVKETASPLTFAKPKWKKGGQPLLVSQEDPDNRKNFNLD